MTTTKLKTIDLNIFPVDKTIFKLLEGENNRKERINTEIESWKTRFPSAEPRFGDVMMIYLSSNASYDKCLSYFNSYNLESKIFIPASQDALKEIDLLFKVNETDTELIKLLKDIANDEEPKVVLEANFKDVKKGVIWMVFVLETFKSFYLNYLPGYIEEKLEKAKLVKLEDIKDLIKPVINDLYICLFSSFVKVERESDLEKLKNDVEEKLDELKKIVNDAKDEKEPKEDIEAIKKELADAKDKLAIYEKTFGYMYHNDPDLANLVSKWWTDTSVKWANTFQDGYKSLYSGSLEKLKKDWDDREQQIKNWLDAFPISEYPKGAGSIKEVIIKLQGSQGNNEELNNQIKTKDDIIKAYDAYIDAVLEKQSQQPVYILTEEPEEIKPKAKSRIKRSDRITQ